MNIDCTGNSLIQEKSESAYRGLCHFKKIWKKYHKLSYFAMTLVLIFPDDDLELVKSASERIDAFMEHTLVKRFIIISVSDIEAYFCSSKYYHGITLISSDQMNDIVQSFSFFYYFTNTLFISLKYPEGRNAEDILSCDRIKKDDIIKGSLLNYYTGWKNLKAEPCNYIRGYMINMLVKYSKILAMYTNSRLFINTYLKYKLMPGAHIYNELAEKYPNALLCPSLYWGTGDVYLAAALLPSWLERNNISDYVFLTIGKSNQRVCSLFGINAILKTQREMLELQRFCIFMGLKCTETKFLHHHGPRLSTGILDIMRNVNDLDFMTMYMAGVFGSTDFSTFRSPKFNTCQEDIDALFMKYNLVKGKTVVIAPYNNTLAKVNLKFWNRIAAELKKMGYVVCTNSSKKSEKPLKGTLPVFFPYSISVPFLNEAGYFISVRSGLCDIIASSSCKKVILYSSGLYWNDKDVIDYFSLNTMKLCSDAIEITYYPRHYSGLDKKILEHFDALNPPSEQ